MSELRVASPPISTDHTPSPPLRLAPECVALAGEGVLYVLTRRGSFDVKGKDVVRLHKKLSPFLQGTHTEADLLAAVPPPQAAAVQAYLARLRSMGALHDPGTLAEPGSGAMQALGPRHPRLAFRAGEVIVHVSLDGPVPPGREHLRLSFVRVPAAGRLLLGIGSSEQRRGRLTCVLVESGTHPPSDGELQRRAMYARWLLRNELDVLSAGPRTQFFRLDAENGSLERLVITDPSDPTSVATVPDQLGLVRRVAVDQVPLVVAEISHPLFTETVAGCGLTLPELRDHLMRAFVVRTMRRSQPRGGGVFLTGTVGAPRRTYVPARVSWDHVARSLSAPSLPSLQLALLEAFADGRSEQVTSLEDLDLLASGAEESTRVEYLRSVLRLRLSTLVARLTTTRDGLIVCEAGGRRTRSFLRQKAIADLLLLAVRDEFYGGVSQQMGATFLDDYDHHSVASEADIRWMARELVTTLNADGERVRVGVRRVRCWGTAFWVGYLDGVPTEGSL